ncbi:MAG: lipopolysaccharide biosynthesis protein [Bacteroidetes bacterium]|nr:lipopolysaccharide biosynthesis protein [Bacteroidota bacterium]
MISKSFLKSSIIYTIGGALPMAAGLILLPFYTNYLNDLHFTQVAFYISVSLLMQILFSYSIESYFGIKYSKLKSDPQQQKRFIGTVAILLLVIGAGLLLISAVSGTYIFSKVFNPAFQMEFWPFGFYSVLTAFFNSYFKASTNALIYLKKPGLFFTANLINFIATIGISVGGLFLFPDTIIGPIYGRLLSGVIIFTIANYIYLSNGKFKYEKDFIGDLKAFCTPYVIYVSFVWLLSYTDRYMLQEFIPNTDLNTYDLVLKCFFGIEFLQNSLTAIIYPKIYEIWADQKELHTSKETNRYFNVFTAINILLLIVFCITIPLLYKLVISNEKFYESEKYIGILAAGYGLRSILYFYLATILYSKNIKILLKIFGISAAFQLAVTYFVVKDYGLMGAIYTGLGVKVLQIILSYLFTKNIFRYEFNGMKIIGIPFLYLALNVALFYFHPEYSLTLYIAQLAVFSIIFFLIFNNEIKAVYKQFAGKKA